MTKRAVYFAVLLSIIALLAIGCTSQNDEGPNNNGGEKAMTEQNGLQNDESKKDELPLDGSSDETSDEAAGEADEEAGTDEASEGDIHLDDYPEMIKRSLISSGNNYRLKKVIEKAQRGEEVTIAYIGGSITEGASSSSLFRSYAYLSFQHFRESFGADDGSNVKFVNAGMGGTPSALGVIRYERDVITHGRGGQPDIVFIEFAVNDYNEPTNGGGYESLVLNVLQADNEPAVVLLFSVFRTQWNLQDKYKPLGRYYDLPMISIRDAVVPEINAGRLTNEKFFADEYHPTDYGHGIMAEAINHYFDVVYLEEPASEDIQFPDQPLFSDAFVGIKMLEANTEAEGVTIERGSFSDTDEALVTLSYAPRKTFPDNWKHSQGNGNESFKVTLNAKNIMLVYKESSSPSFGAADVYLDGEFVRTINSHASGGWNNPQTVVILNTDEVAERKLEVKMAEGNEDKEFTIMAIGYTQ